MKKDPKFFIVHIYESILAIEKYTKAFSYEKFLKNIQLQDAVIRRLEIIGEATKNLPLNFREKYSDISWKKMTGTRDIISHEYFGVDFPVIWEIIKKDLKPLKIKIINLLENLNSD